MKPGRKPKPTAIRKAEGNPGKRGFNPDEPQPPEGLPGCPDHLSDAAKAEWHRLAVVLHGMGVLTTVDRAAFAAYCQAWGRWVEAEEKLKETPPLIRTGSGYVQQSPWLSIANKQLELMGRYMTEMGLTPASRSRVAAYAEAAKPEAEKFEFRILYEDADGSFVESPLTNPDRKRTVDAEEAQREVPGRFRVDPRL